MKTFLTLIKYEYKGGANWFKENTLAKLFVIIGFLTVIFGIVFGEYRITSIYLTFANEYAPFGPEAAVYSLKVAVFLLFVFSIVSATAISSSTLYRNAKLTHLFTLPVKPIIIFMSRVIPGWLSSTMILLLLIPLFMVYNKMFFKSDHFVAMVTLGLLALSVASQALGVILATCVAYFLGKITRQKWFLIVIALLIGFIALTRLLFPAGILGATSADNFLAFKNQIDNLPLAGKVLPTNWLVEGLAGDINWISILSAGLAIFCLLSIIRTIGEVYYLTAWRRAQSQAYFASNEGIKTKNRSNFPKMKGSKSIYWPLAINDLISLVRSNSEVNYSLFLGSLLAVLFFSINKFSKLPDITPGILLAVYLITFASVSLIFLISATRLIYPMMAKEKLTGWFSFSLPISREQYLKEKLLVSILLTIPGLLITVIMVWQLKLSFDQSFVLMAVLAATILFINIIQCLMGSINPNFNEANNPEAVSTSSLGILALIMSLGFIVVSTIQLNSYFHGTINGYVLAIRWILMAIIIVTPTLLVATKSVRKYLL